MIETCHRVKLSANVSARAKPAQNAPYGAAGARPVVVEKRAPGLPRLSLAVRTVPAVAFLVCTLFQGCRGGREGARWSFEAMGTAARVEIYHAEPGLAAEGLETVRSVFDSVEATMSTWNPDSEISRINRAPAGSTLALSPWLNACLSRAEDIREASGGAFDPTSEPLMRLWGFYRREGKLPSPAQIDSAEATMGAYVHDVSARTVVKKLDGTSFDLGGIAKGYALDRAAQALGGLGIRDALIDLGGNLVCMGSPPGRETWRVGIRDPQEKDKLFATVETGAGAVSTSGSYERYVVIGGRRYGHIMNPATGRPAEGLLSVTVLAPDATLADGLSTALFVLGFDKARDVLSRRFSDVKVVFVLSPQGAGPPAVVASSSLRGGIALRPDRKTAYTLRFF
jgi:thiamine biosynthesis lipoprotein